MPDVLSPIDDQIWYRFLNFAENSHIGKACQNAQRLMETALWETFVKSDATSTVYRY